jgi:lipopolysaccharide/colanic/teichoic acid biosynthesis glycosyltransferase
VIVKRTFDLLLASLALVALAPFLLLISAWVKLDSPGPVFFRQVRVGRGGREFRIFKFRTMRTDAERIGPQITVGTDSRVTLSGSFLRKYKLDELPQFINVLLGDMSVVGPRPEVPRYVACYPAHIAPLVLSVRPGITDRASIEYRYESDLLGSSSDPEATYIQEVLPVKLAYYADYAANHSLLGDIQIVLSTIGAVFSKK